MRSISELRRESENEAAEAEFQRAFAEWEKDNPDGDEEDFRDLYCDSDGFTDARRLYAVDAVSSARSAVRCYC